MDATEEPSGIGALSKRSGCNIETIRYYERIGLLPKPPRTAGGYRRYGLDHLKRLVFVRRARNLGFTLDQVRALLALAEQRERSCAKVERLALAHLADVREKIVDLRAMATILEEMVDRCAEGTVPECPLIDALFEEPLSRRVSETRRRIQAMRQAKPAG